MSHQTDVILGDSADESTKIYMNKFLCKHLKFVFIHLLKIF